MIERNWGRFAKWQNVTRGQLGATSNLLLGLATGSLAFSALLLVDRKLIETWAFAFGIVGSVFLLISVALALWCTVNRLNDFRLTAKIANPKYRSSPQIDELREESNRLGERTWYLFRAQMWTFSLGASAAVVGILVQVLSRLTIVQP